MAKKVRTGFFINALDHNSAMGINHPRSDIEKRVFKNTITGIRYKTYNLQTPSTGYHNIKFFDAAAAVTPYPAPDNYYFYNHRSYTYHPNLYSQDLNIKNQADPKYSSFGMAFRGGSDNVPSLMEFNLNEFSDGIFINYWQYINKHIYYAPIDILRFHFGADLYSVSIDFAHDNVLELKNLSSQTVLESASFDPAPSKFFRNIDISFDKDGRLEVFVGGTSLKVDFPNGANELLFFAALLCDHSYYSISNLAINDGSGTSDNTRPAPIKAIPVFYDQLSLVNSSGFTVDVDRGTFGTSSAFEGGWNIESLKPGREANGIKIYLYDRARYNPDSFTKKGEEFFRVTDAEGTAGLGANIMYINDQDEQDGYTYIYCFFDYNYHTTPVKKIIELIDGSNNPYFKVNKLSSYNPDHIISHVNNIRHPSIYNTKDGGDKNNFIFPDSIASSTSANPNVKLNISPLSDLIVGSSNIQKLANYYNFSQLNVYLLDAKSETITSAKLQLELTDKSDSSKPALLSSPVEFSVDPSLALLEVSEGLDFNSLNSGNINIDLTIDRY